ncbi:MAG: hypothetical protein ACI8WB_005081 [Phenylobacterium sp.]|jgi:hypothetical protein
MKILKYSLIASAMGLASFGATAAKYQIVDVGPDNASQSFGIGINNNDVLVGVSNNHFNFPVDLANLNYDALESTIISAGLSDTISIEDIRNGVIDATALTFIRSYLGAIAGFLTQKVGDQVAFIADASGTSELTLFDEFDPVLNSKTRNTTDLVNAINDNGIAVSSATTQYRAVEVTPEPTEAIPEPVTTTYWVRDALNRKGVITRGDEKVVVESVATQYGGESYLTDISNSGYVVGYGAVAISATAQAAIESVCGEITHAVILTSCVVDTYIAFNPMFEIKAFRWKINDALEIVETTNLGIPFTPHADDNRTFASFATGVNEQGHSVGYAFDMTADEVTSTGGVRLYPSYHDGQTMIRIPSPDDYFEGRAFDINDNDIAVGFGRKIVGGANTPRFFYYDATSGETVYPDGFFSSSASEAHGINNDGMVVGVAQINSSFGTVRREVGFSYDITSDAMTDLNEVVGCNSAYSIVEAKDINDNGVIAATALLTIDKRDAKGVVITNDDGSTVTDEVARAVKLVPIAGGEIDDCDPVVSPGSERQGAGMGLYSLLLMFGLYARRKLVR